MWLNRKKLNQFQKNNQMSLKTAEMPMFIYIYIDLAIFDPWWFVHLMAE